MPDAARTLAVFDFNGTIFGGFLFVAILSHHFRHRVKRQASLRFLATHLPGIIAYKLGWASRETMTVRWADDLAQLFKGFDAPQQADTFSWLSAYFMRRLRPAAAVALRRHQKAGHTTVLLSAAFTELLEPIRRDLGMDHAVGTDLERGTGGHITGRIVPPSCQGEHKPSRLRRFIAESGIDYDLTASHAYADSILDLPLLEAVGHPVATFPDAELLRIARRCGWPVIREYTRP